MKHSKWSYRFQLPEALRRSIHDMSADSDLARMLTEESFKIQFSRYWAAFIYDEIWMGLGERIYRLHKKTGRLINTFLIPEDYYATFQEYCIIPLRPIGPQMMIFGVLGMKCGEYVLLPFILDFSTPEPQFIVLDALDPDTDFREMDWSLHLTKELSPYQRPLVNEIDVSALKNIYEFVILNLADLINAKKMTLVYAQEPSQKTACGDFPFIATDNCYSVSLSSNPADLHPSIQAHLLKEINLAGEKMLVDFHEKTHVSFHYLRE